MGQVKDLMKNKMTTEVIKTSMFNFKNDVSNSDEKKEISLEKPKFFTTELQN